MPNRTGYRGPKAKATKCQKAHEVVRWRVKGKERLNLIRSDGVILHKYGVGGWTVKGKLKQGHSVEDYAEWLKTNSQVEIIRGEA